MFNTLEPLNRNNKPQKSSEAEQMEGREETWPQFIKISPGDPQKISNVITGHAASLQYKDCTSNASRITLQGWTMSCTEGKKKHIMKKTKKTQNTNLAKSSKMKIDR